MDDAPQIKVSLPGEKDRLIGVDADPFTIGRRRDNHLVLADKDISRVQVILRKEEAGWVLEDQQSHFGTSVNGEPVTRALLRNRDVITFGRERTIELLFLHGDRMRQILDQVDRTPSREVSREEARSLRLLLEISKGFNSYTSLGDLLELALDAAIDLTQAERGFVMLRDASGALQMQAARNMAGERIRPENLRISMSIVSEVVREGRGIFLADALERSDLRDRSSIAELKLRSIACLPIRLPGLDPGQRGPRRPSRPGDRVDAAPRPDIRGVIYTDSSQATRPATETVRELVDSIATHAGIALENYLLRQEEMEHRLLEKEMEKLREVDRLKSEFVSHVSHELRTPLTAIKGAIDNMLDGLTGSLAEKQERYLHRMKSNTEHLVRLIEDLLDLSRIEAGRVELNPRPLSLSRLVVEVCDSLRPLASAKSIDLGALAPPELTVIADRDRLIQILHNLVGNSLKFTPAGGRVAVAAEPSGEMVRITVADNGIGIDPAERPRIFERFYRAAPPGESAEGTGLGLTIAKSLVEMHGGTIGCESREGAGTVFVVALPAAGPPPRGTRDGSAAPPPSGAPSLKG